MRVAALEASGSQEVEKIDALESPERNLLGDSRLD